MRLLATPLFLALLGLLLPLGRATHGAEPPAQQAAALPSPETVVEGVTSYRLANGLRVLLVPDPASSKVTVLMAYFVGSRHEGRGERGMAHLLEHLLFKGSENFPEPAKSLKEHGAYSNASTWTDRTLYFEEMLATDDNLDFALQFEADRMLNSFISDESLKSEMTVVRNEFEMGENDPFTLVLRGLLAKGYTWHPYGAATIGNRSDIERVPGANLRAFYKQHYRPSNAMLVLCGKFNPTDARARIEQYFSPLTNPQAPLIETWTEEPTQDGPRTIEIEREGTQPSIGVMYHVPAFSNDESAALRLLNPLLSDLPWGRLYKSLVETGLAAQVSVIPFLMAERGQLLVIATLKDAEHSSQTLDALKATMEGFAQHPITQEEVDRARASWLSQLKSVRSGNLDFAYALAEAESGGDWRLWFIERDRIKSVTPDQLQEAATRYFVPSNRTTAVFTPVKSPIRAAIPPRPDIPALVSSYKGTETVILGEAFDATPANIESRAIRSKLADGVQLTVVPKKTANATVKMVIAIRFGTEKTLLGKNIQGSLAAAMLSRGTTNMSFQQRSDELDRMQTTVIPSFQNGVVTLTIASDRSNIERAIEIAGDMLRNPLFPASEFEVVKADQAAFARSQTDQPFSLAWNAMLRAAAPFTKDQYYYVPTLAERADEIAATTLDDVKQFYKLVGPANVQIAVVGDTDANAISQAARKLLNNWTAGVAFERVERPFVAVSKGITVIQTPDKPMATVGMAAVLPLKDSDPQACALTIATNILGRGLHSRIGTRLRGQDGLSYDSLTTLQLGRMDAVSTFLSYAICARENADKTAAALREEIDRWIRDGITQEELSEAKKGYRLSLLSSFSNDATLADLIARDTYSGRTMAWHAQFLSQLDGLQQKDVNDAIRKWFSGASFAEVRAGDFPAKDVR